MSTKIYYAWRVPINKLNETFDHVRPQIYDDGEVILQRAMDAVTEGELVKRKKSYRMEFSEAYMTFEIAMERVKEASKAIARDPMFDVDFVFNVWLNGDYAYLIPIGEHRDLKMPEWAEDYSYWNDVDQPEDVSEEDWKAREAKWDEINCGEGVHSQNARRLCHSVIDLSMPLGDFAFEHEMGVRLIKKK